MTEAPERIGLVQNGIGGFALWNREDNKFDPAIEYVRADIACAELEALDPDAIAKIRADALREAVEAIAYKAKEADLTAALADDAGHYLAADMDREVAAGIRIGAAAILALIQKEKDDA